MKKLELCAGGGYDSPILGIKEKKFYSYETDREEIHEKFGGEHTYSSLTGLSTAGWVPLNDFIVFGYYRTDAKNEQKKEIVHITESGKEIFGYLPIVSHKGIDYNFPVILTDGKCVIFSNHNPEEVISWLKDWGKWEKEERNQRNGIYEIEESFYDPNGIESTKRWWLVNFHHYKGIRATRFIDLRNHRYGNKGTTNEGLLHNKLNIEKYQEKDFWLHQNQDGVFDTKFGSDPRTIKGEIIEGWIGFGNGVIYRRRDTKVECFIELNREEISNGKWWIENETPKFIDYEKDFSVIDFFSKTEEEITETMLELISKKAKEDYIFARKRSGGQILDLMKKNPETYICVQDSIDAGNCLPGTENFISRFDVKINESGCVKIEKLLSNNNIEKMVKDFSFQKVVYRKLEIDEHALTEDEEMKEKLD